MLTGRLSPDVRWLAYVSDESGRNELYVIPFAPEDAASKRVGGEMADLHYRRRPTSVARGWQGAVLCHLRSETHVYGSQGWPREL